MVVCHPSSTFVDILPLAYDAVPFGTPRNNDVNLDYSSNMLLRISHLSSVVEGCNDLHDNEM